MLEQIKQFSVFKEIMDNNCQLLGINSENHEGGTKFKAIDCKVMNNIFEEYRRNKVMAKIRDDDFIFVQRSSHKQKQMMLRMKTKQDLLNSSGPVNVNQIDLQLADKMAFDGDDKIEEKRTRNLFKKLYHLNTQRLLEIVGYQAHASDERKFMHSNHRQ